MTKIKKSTETKGRPVPLEPLRTTYESLAHVFIMAIDPASVTGYAYGMGNETPIHGFRDLRVTKIRGYGDTYAEALLFAEGFLLPIAESYVTRTGTVHRSVWLEVPTPRSNPSSGIQWGIFGIYAGVFKRAGYQLDTIYPTTLKSKSVGSGRADKNDMIAHAKKIVPEISDHNAADAVCLFDYARRYNTYE